MPDSWVEKLFQKFEDWYGAKWAAQYGAFPRERVKATWAEELAGFAEIPDALGQAMQTQKASPWPPSLPEFLGVCRDAAKRIGKPSHPALEHKLSPEDIALNRARLAKMASDLSRAKTAGGGE